MMKGFEIKNMTDTSADMYVSGQICDDEDKLWLRWLGDDDGNVSGFVFPVDIKNQLDALKGKALNVYINSVGGSVFAGIAIANMLQRHDGTTTAIIDGIAASIATQIFFSCQNKQMPENAYLMIHKPWSSVSGDADDMLKAADTLDTIQKGIEALYVKNAKPGVTADQIHEMTNNETWLTGPEAAELFNIDVTDAVEAVACAGSLPSRFKNLPKNVQLTPENAINKAVIQVSFDTKKAEKDLKKIENDLKRKQIYIEMALAKGRIIK